MRIVMLACTVRGFSLMRRAGALLARRMPEAEIVQEGRCARVPGYEDGPRLSESTEKWFLQADALVFFAAAGIAVRCIAPFVKDKYVDPAVLAVDEGGNFCISLLSGHVGGANRLCRILAQEIGAVPVITTATDIQRRFAADVFARRNGLQIHSREAAKRISARVVAGETVRIFFDEEIYAVLDEDTYADVQAAESVGGKPAEMLSERIDTMPGVQKVLDRSQADILVTVRRKPCDRADALYLVPPTVTVGIGCRKGTPEAAIRKAVESLLRQTGIFREALSALASIEIKKEEPGLRAFAADWALPITFYSAAQLQGVPGVFTGSPFVERTTGVDNVCERSAVRLATEQKDHKDFKDHKEYNSPVPDRLNRESEAGEKEKKSESDISPQKTLPAGSGDGGEPVRLLAEKYCENGVTVAFAACNETILK